MIQVYCSRLYRLLFCIILRLVNLLQVALLFLKGDPSPSPTTLIWFVLVSFNSVSHRGHFSPLHLCMINPFKKKTTLISNCLDFESNLFTNTPENCCSNSGKFPNFRFAEVTFQNLSIFGRIFNLNDIIRRFVT